MRLSRCPGVGKGPVSPVSSVISVSLSPAAPPLVWMGVVGRSAVEKRGEIH